MSRTRLIHGDMRKALAKLIKEGVTIHAVVSDPPYNLESIKKRFGGKNAAPAKGGKTGAFKRASRGFMNLRWDSDVAFQADTWRLAYELLPPGGYLVAFGGTRTYHRLVSAIEAAGFDIRDCITWLYGSGFPKSHNVAKAIDRKAGKKGKVVGQARGHDIRGGKLLGNAVNGRANITTHHDVTEPATPEAAEWAGWGTALKPAAELICLARKPLDGTVAGNVLKHGTGAINIDGCRVGVTDAAYAKNASGDRGHADNREREMDFAMTAGSANAIGRWPANVVHDGSEEVVAAFPVTASGELKTHHRRTGKSQLGTFNIRDRTGELANFGGDLGTAARFFYSAKADKRDRLLSKHPTVKPVDLMRWLVRLVTPPGGTVLDPFAGSGSTLMACMAEGFDCIMVEKKPGYLADIRRRVKHVKGEDTPLFGGPIEEATLPLFPSVVA